MSSITSAYNAIQKAVSTAQSATSSNKPSAGSGFVDALKSQASEISHNLKNVDKAVLDHMMGNISSEDLTNKVVPIVTEAKGMAEVIRSTADATTKVLNITV